MTIIENTLTWQDVLQTSKDQPYFHNILSFLADEAARGKTIYPESSHIFAAFKLTDFNKVKVVILGQDPYHGPAQAHGLCFSVQQQTPPPPSLKNIFKELASDLNVERPQNGDLSPWAKQGVLLLNTVLTVEAGRAHSHANIGWETFTDAVISALNEHTRGVVFLLWGEHAKKKCHNIDTSKHSILTAPHPSPLSAHRGYLGCKHFSKANELLIKTGQEPINWQT
jgi:uracil-DNA glycosylase